MAFTGTTIETAVRALANDEDVSAERYTDAQLIEWINEATRLIWEGAPRSRFNGSGAIGTFAEIDALANAVCFFYDKWQQPIIDYCMMRMMEMEGDDTQDLKRARFYAGRFEAFTGIMVQLRGV